MVSEALARLAHFFARDLHAILWDVADIALVATILYFLLLLLKGTRAMQMGVGIVLVFVVYQSAKRLGLVTLFSKKRKHYLTIGYTDASNAAQVAVIELGKDAVRSTLAIVETRSGQALTYQDEDARKAGLDK